MGELWIRMAKRWSEQSGPPWNQTYSAASGQVCTLSRVVVILFPECSTTAWAREQTSVLIISGLFVITSLQGLSRKSMFTLPILLLPNENYSRTQPLKQHHFQIISRCPAADGPQTYILNENYHTLTEGGRGWREAHYQVWKVMNIKYYTLN